MQYILLISLLVSTCSYAQEKLIFAIDIIRHGDRMPIIASTGMQSLLQLSPGQLTSRGMQAEYQLGKILRKEYVKKYKLLPKHYDHETMHVRSSAYDRTLMSAEAILVGLYPLGTGPKLKFKHALPKGLQPIPIYTVERAQDNLLVTNHNNDLYQKLLADYIFHETPWLQKNLELQANYVKWSNISGVQINNLYDLILLGDKLSIENLYHVPQNLNLSAQDIDLIINAANWAFVYIANNPKLAEILGGQLKQTILQAIQKAGNNELKLKYMLFVAHDTTIMAQLKLLGYEISTIPQYNARLNYSLFSLDNGQYKVKITYDKEPLLLAKCGGFACNLEDFLQFFG